MTTHTASPSSAPSPDDAARVGAAWARPALEADLAVLAELRDLGMAITRALAAGVEAQAYGAGASAEAAPEAAPALTSDPALAYSRVSRAVRLTCALRARLIDDIERLEELQRRRGEVRDAQARAERKGQIARLLTRIIHDEAEAHAAAGGGDADGADGAEPVETLADPAETEGDPGEAAERGEGRSGEIDVERLIDEASERLSDRERFGDVLARPVSAFIDAICRDLGLSPDWPRLAREAWAQKEMAEGAPIFPSPSMGEGLTVRSKRPLPRVRREPLPIAQAAGPEPGPPISAEADRETEARNSPGVEPPPPPPPRILTAREIAEAEEDAAYAAALPGELPPRRPRLSWPAAPP